MFDSMHPYKYLITLEAKTPQALASKIRTIKSPIKVLEFTANDKGHYAYVLTDASFFKRLTLFKEDNKENNNGNSSR